MIRLLSLEPNPAQEFWLILACQCPGLGQYPALGCLATCWLAWLLGVWPSLQSCSLPRAVCRVPGNLGNLHTPKRPCLQNHPNPCRQNRLTGTPGGSLRPVHSPGRRIDMGRGALSSTGSGKSGWGVRVGGGPGLQFSQPGASRLLGDLPIASEQHRLPARPGQIPAVVVATNFLQGWGLSPPSAATLASLSLGGGTEGSLGPPRDSQFCGCPTRELTLSFPGRDCHSTISFHCGPPFPGLPSVYTHTHPVSGLSQVHTPHPL